MARRARRILFASGGTLLVAAALASACAAEELEPVPDPGAGVSSRREVRPGAQPMSREGALVTIIAGAFMLFLGKKVYRLAVLMMGALAGAHAARLGAFISGYGDKALLFSAVGAAAGGIISIPLEFVLRMMVGAVAGMVVAPVMTAAVSSSVPAIILSAFVGLLVGAATTYFFRRAVLIVGFSLFGATMAGIGVASLRAAGEPSFALGGVEVLGIMLASTVGVAFQYSLEAPEEPEPQEKSE